MGRGRGKDKLNENLGEGLPVIIGQRVGVAPAAQPRGPAILGCERFFPFDVLF